MWTKLTWATMGGRPALRGVLAATLVGGVAAIVNASGLRCDVALSESSEARRVVGGAGGEKRRLEFVHLTKTGGTAIEKAAISVGVRWSMCHFSRISICNSPYTGMHDVQHNDTGGGGSVNTSPWHTPPWVFASHARSFTKNPYDGADLFTVVRNPYTRVVSEYYCPWVGLRDDDPDAMNQWIRQKLEGQTYEGMHGQLERFRTKSVGGGFLIGTKHMIPQYEYVFAPNGDRLIPEENVLRFENIAEDFRELMARYSLGEWIKLSEEKTNAGKRSAQLSHLDLYPDTVRMINSFFERDFEAFGYERVEAFRQKAVPNRTMASGNAISTAGQSKASPLKPSFQPLAGRQCRPIQTSAQCSTEAVNLGAFPTRFACARESSAHASCGDLFMFSTAYPEWECRCCSDSQQTTGNDNWALYSAASCARKHIATRKKSETKGQAKLAALRPANRAKNTATSEVPVASLKLAICAIAKDEGPYLSEWIEHHRLIGFDTILLYNDNSTDDTQCVLDAYAQQGDILRVPNDIGSQFMDDLPWNKVYIRGNVQEPIFEACRRYLIDRELSSDEVGSTWMLTSDVDEFLWFDRKKFGTAKETLTTMLSKVPNRKTILIPNCIFGTSGKESFEPQPLMRRFTHRDGNARCLPSQNDGGTIVMQGKPVSQVTALVEGKRIDPHLHIVANSTGSLQAVEGYMRLAHYKTKSREEFYSRVCSSRYYNKYWDPRHEFNTKVNYPGCCSPSDFFDYVGDQFVHQDPMMLPFVDDLERKMSNASHLCNSNLGKAVCPDSVMKMKDQEGLQSMKKFFAGILEDGSATFSSEPQRHHTYKKSRLEFVHITKTGGTAIEKAAIASGARWGYCHFDGGHTCHSLLTKPDTKRNSTAGGGGAVGRAPWHTPPWVFASHAKYFTRDMYEDADLFTVVRNPYTRVISEYYCPWVGLQKDDPDVMNQWIRQKLEGQNPEKLRKELETFRDHGTGDINEFLVGRKHLIPQYEYVFGPNGDRLIPEENVLRFENITDAFEELMERYGLSGQIQLPDEKINVGKEGKRLSHLDLDPTTVQLINSFFERDFEAFGYECVEAFRQKNATEA